MTAVGAIYPIESFGHGMLAIGAHPASHGDPAIAIAGIAASGIEQVVSLLEAEEAQALGLRHEAELVAARGMDFISLPIPDMGVPASLEEFSGLSRRLYQRLQAGGKTLIHCRAGVGRSGLLAAAVLMHAGRDARQAFARVASRRGLPLPETRAQGSWLAANQSAIRGDSNSIACR